MQGGAGGGGGGGGGGAGAGAGGAGAGGAPKNLPLNYICGHCNSLNRLSPRDIVRCKECGYRIFYKVRPDRRACPPPLPLGLRSARRPARVAARPERRWLVPCSGPGSALPSRACLLALACAWSRGAARCLTPHPRAPPHLFAPASLFTSLLPFCARSDAV